MDLLFLEALGAGVLFVFIVWWTMFSGRRRGEPLSAAAPREEVAASPAEEPPR